MVKMAYISDAESDVEVDEQGIEFKKWKVQRPSWRSKTVRQDVTNLCNFRLTVYQVNDFYDALDRLSDTGKVSTKTEIVPVEMAAPEGVPERAKADSA